MWASRAHNQPWTGAEGPRMAGGRARGGKLAAATAVLPLPSPSVNAALSLLFSLELHNAMRGAAQGCLFCSMFSLCRRARRSSCYARATASTFKSAKQRERMKSIECRCSPAPHQLALGAAWEPPAPPHFLPCCCRFASRSACRRASSASCGGSAGRDNGPDSQLGGRCFGSRRAQLVQCCSQD